MATLALKALVNFLLLFFIIIRVKINHYFQLNPWAEFWGVLYLTLEDMPPKSLGGKPSALTCTSCNNKSGHERDARLSQKLMSIDAKSYIHNSNADTTITFNG